MRAHPILAALTSLLLIGSAHAQYPAKAVRMVIPFPPGGATDIVGRVVAQKLSERWGQPVVVEPAGDSGEDFVRQVRADMKRWSEVVKAANVKVQ